MESNIPPKFGCIRWYILPRHLFPPGSGAIPLLNTYDGTLTGTVKQATVVRLVKGSNATTKNFTLSYEGQTTSTMHYDASAAEVEYKLEALGNVGDVSVERSLRVDKKLNVSLTLNRGEEMLVHRRT